MLIKEIHVSLHVFWSLQRLEKDGTFSLFKPFITLLNQLFSTYHVAGTVTGFDNKAVFSEPIFCYWRETVNRHFNV